MTTIEQPPAAAAPGTRFTQAGRHHPDHPARLVLPRPPDDDEKYAYIHRNLPFLTTSLVISATCLTISQIRFAVHDPVLWPFLVFTAAYVLYQLIGLPVNFTGRGFDLAAHQARVQAWRPSRYPGLDIFLPICGEPIEVLHNTWSAVSALLADYPGPAQAYVLDDGPSDEACALAASMGLAYIRRPGHRVHKKAGNLRYAFARTTSEYIVILDADFAPRPDFLAETLPYLDDPGVGIVQTPQYFRQNREQTWIENAAGAIQEVFYRSIQVARDRFGAAICVGTSAVYRRAALEPQGGPTLIPYAEDVHTGLDVRLAGWSVVYVPILLSTGICPDNLDSFVRQQYRWCTGNAGIVFSRRLWRVPDVHSSPAHFLVRILLLRLYRAAQLRRAADPERDARLLAGPDQAAQLRHPAPGRVLRLRPLLLVASRQLRTVRLAAGHRARLGPRLRPVGRRPGKDDELAPDPLARQFAAPLPGRGDLVERRPGSPLGAVGSVAVRDVGLAAVHRPAGLRPAQSHRREPCHLSRKEASMKYRLVTLISFLVTVTAIAITTHHLNFGYSNKPTVRAPPPG